MSTAPTERFLVTGGTGFIGRYVVRRLTAAGHRPVVTQFGGSSTDLDLPPYVELVELDLRDRDRLTELLRAVEPTVVMHLAGVTGQADPTGRLCDEINFRSTCFLLDSLVGRDLKSVVLLGTAGEYGPQTVPFHEDMADGPLSQYALSKSKANRYALGLWKLEQLPVTILRPFSVYGVDQPRNRFLAQLVFNAVKDLEFKMSEGTQHRDFVHVDEVADAILLAASSPNAAGRVINIAGGRGHRLADVAQATWRHCGANPELLKIGALEAIGDDAFDSVADVTTAADLLNWRPSRVFLDGTEPGEGLTEMIDAARSSCTRAAAEHTD